nr:hypothetical protein [uncultured archaeon]
MATNIQQLKTLKKGDYIEVSDDPYYDIHPDHILYFKVLNVKQQGLVLSDSFSKGSKAKGEWFSEFKEHRDYDCWIIIPQDSKKAKGIEEKVK